MAVGQGFEPREGY